MPVQASVYGDDPRPEVVALIERYKQKFKDGPVTEFAFPIYSFLQLWAQAVEKAGTVDAAKVVAVLNSFHDRPSILGPRSFFSTVAYSGSVPLPDRVDQQSHR